MIKKAKRLKHQFWPKLVCLAVNTFRHLSEYSSFSSLCFQILIYVHSAQSFQDGPCEAGRSRSRHCQRRRDSSVGGAYHGPTVAAGSQVSHRTTPISSTRAGCECIAHALQGLCDLNPSARVTLIDGVGAFDSISRRAMLTGLAQVAGGASTLPFVRMFYASPSQYLWDDDDGVSHTVPQGEGGEQGDAMMPLLFSLGQHDALQAANQNMREGEFLFAFHDDVVMVTNPDRVGPVCSVRFCVALCRWRRPRCGTSLACATRYAMFWRGLHVTTTQQRGSGRVPVCLWISKELRSWAPHCDTKST